MEITSYHVLQELNQRAQGEVTIREAIRELDLWGAGAIFSMTEYEDSNKNSMMLIKDWKDLVSQVICFIFNIQILSTVMFYSKKFFYITFDLKWFEMHVQGYHY